MLRHQHETGNSWALILLINNDSINITMVTLTSIRGMTLDRHGGT